jgi:protein-S-isoprenylcysteine O-methyltransferase Ste14
VRQMNALVPPPVVAAIVGATMYLVDRSVALGKIESPWQAHVAMALLFGGLACMGAAVVSFVIAKTTINPMQPARASHLITTGIYRVSRNPIYVADVLLLTAWAVWLGSVINVALIAAFVWYIQRYQIMPEEQALTKRFGENYTAYSRRVRRWL